MREILTLIDTIMTTVAIIGVAVFFLLVVSRQRDANISLNKWSAKRLLINAEANRIRQQCADYDEAERARRWGANNNDRIMTPRPPAPRSQIAPDSMSVDGVGLPEKPPLKDGARDLILD